jgi:hypothetical protein
MSLSMSSVRVLIGLTLLRTLGVSEYIPLAKHPWSIYSLLVHMGEMLFPHKETVIGGVLH